MSTRTDTDRQTAVRGADLARALNGLTPVDRRLRDTACPWCEAKAGRPCIVPGLDTRLVLVPAHFARYRAAGLEAPEPVVPADRRLTDRDRWRAKTTAAATAEDAS